MSLFTSIPLSRLWYSLIILASLLPAAVLAPWLSSQAHSLLLDRAMLSEELYHKELATTLYLEMDRLTAVLQSKSDTIAYILGHQGSTDAVRELIATLSRRDAEISSIVILGPSAQVIATANMAAFSADRMSRSTPAFAVPMHGRIFIGSPRRLADNQLGFLIAIPLIAGDKSLGVMIGAIHMDEFWQSIQSRLPAHHSRTYLTDGRGSLLTRLADHALQQGALLSEKPIVRALLAREEWHRHTTFPGINGQAVFGIGTLVHTLEWGIISEIPAASIDAEITRAQHILVTIVIFLHMLFAIVGLLWIRRLLAPVSQLTQVMKEAADGDYTGTMAPSRYREIDTLGRSFNRMIHAIEQRQSALEKMTLAMEQLGEAIIITDHNGIIEYVNSAFTRNTGFTATEVIGKSPRLLNSRQQSETFYQELWQTILTGQTWHGTLTNRKKDGSLYPVLMSIAAIHHHDRITHFVAVQQDMSRQNMLEEQLRQSQKMEAIGTLVGGIAHDFNNMLAGMTGNLYLAKRKIPAESAAMEKLANVELLSFRAAEMIQQLLTFARKGVVSMKPVALAPFIRELSSFIHTAVPENIAMTEEICSEEMTILGDKAQLHQVMLNLVNNARDALDGIAQPHIEIRLAPFSTDEPFLRSRPHIPPGRYALLSVSDNGCGIPAEQMKHLYEPFFTTKEQGKGTGLGLAMVFGAIQTHGGFIEVESAADKGTTFHIYLPLSEATGTTEPGEWQSAPPCDGEGAWILLADDEQHIRETGKEVLEEMGYRVMIAAHGREAVELYSAHASTIALCIFDLVMPVMGGHEAAIAIRTINPHARIIFATGYDKSILAGMGDETIISKPFTIEAISQLIAQKLNRPSDSV
ncbi:PAS domain S-box protein [Mariprofundus erugo]|uniref:ATP-binding protein n=1 Tax=Mariprofundus erugo TaxID=2528639 RepID=UPI0010FF55C4|nr:ATP-binding protein [Mariprofundus erugo]TLS77118.1 PAS domain S-box protein [Mariprofundus erugo]